MNDDLVQKFMAAFVKMTPSDQEAFKKAVDLYVDDKITAEEVEPLIRALIEREGKALQ